MTRLRARDDLAVGTGAFLLVVALAEAYGGYFPTAWGWCVLALAWVAGLALVVGDRIEVGRLQLWFLGAVTAVIGWMALSILWSSDVEQSVLEVERGLIYVIGTLACVLVVARRSIGGLLAGLTAGIVWISVQALESRLFAGADASSAQVALGRLAGPIGYFNALGVFAAMGALLALGCAVHGRAPAARVASAAALPVLLTTTYFTFSRGATLALVAGLLAAIALDPRRMRLLAAGPVLMLPAALAVWLAARHPALTSASAPRGVVEQEGHTLAIELLAITCAAATLGLLVAWLEPRFGVPRRARRAYVVTLAGAGVAALALAGTHYGLHDTPAGAVYPGVGESVTGSALAANDLNTRLGSSASSGRLDNWRVAIREFEQHSLLGSGAGTYEQYWWRYRPNELTVRDAHSLYLETLGQLGWPGLALVLGMLALPLLAALRARRDPLVAGAFGAYVAYVVHTGIDWDWEVPVVTLVALLCGAAMLAAAGDGASRRQPLGLPGRALAVVAVIAVAVFAMTGVAANRALAEGASDADSDNLRGELAAARTALHWAPWSAQAYHELGRAQLDLGESRLGRASLREAARRDPDDWQTWYDLAVASSGAERRRALDTAARLNPREPGIRLLLARSSKLSTVPKHR
ncbi:MAG TPA: O-antigen ligase family protein [Solirubrobacteraceae bacterium]|nr:O-antigen ligase family protein [Solirubrobacteraceae bacterium]